MTGCDIIFGGGGLDRDRFLREWPPMLLSVKEGNLKSHTWGPLLLSCISMIEDDNNNLDRALFDVGQILADLDLKMSKS